MSEIPLSSLSALKKNKKQIKDAKRSESGESIDISDNLLKIPFLNNLNNDYIEIKIDDIFVVEVKNGKIKKNSIEAKELCKVMKFPIKLNILDILKVISDLKPKDYPTLFVFIIEINRAKTNLQKIKENLLKFGQNRPLVVQFISTKDSKADFYFKNENSQFFNIDLKNTNFRQFKNFPTFLSSFLSGKFKNINNEVLNLIPDVRNSSIILRFLKVLKLNEQFLNNLVLQIAKLGNKSDLLAVLDASFEENGRLLNEEAQSFLSNEIPKGEYLVSPPDDLNVTSSSEHSQNYSSILYTAIENKNEEIINYLISYCSHLTQQLSLDHQIAISTLAFNMGLFDILCDLIEILDFPFPENLIVNDALSEHYERLQKIVLERELFMDSVKIENLKKIEKFIRNNINLKIVYNSSNVSAMRLAANLEKFKSFFFLKSHGFRAIEFDDLSDVLDEDKLKEANKFATIQRRKNVDYALRDQKKSIGLLYTRSFIHNRSISKELEAAYRKKIYQWYEDINKVEYGPELLKVAASCENLKVIFDFESDTVENASLAGSESLGSMYPVSKWIFVGAKMRDKRREQQIKGILAHELCHYVMKLIYENNENPYYKHLLDIAKKFMIIVLKLDKWSSEDSDDPDDECDGIISSVFKLYESENFHQELIVRVMHILVQFDDNKEMSGYLQRKYKPLFSFWEVFVAPDLRNFNFKTRNLARKLNKSLKLLEKIKNNNFEFASSKNINSLLSNKITIVTTNFPDLLLKNIYCFLQCQQGDIIDTQNVFSDHKALSNEDFQPDLLKLMQECSNIKIFINCSENTPLNKIKNLLNYNQESKIILIISNSEKEELIRNLITDNNIIVEGVRMLYNWSDLSENCQKMLLETKVNFQNSNQFSLLDILIQSQNNNLRKLLNDISDIIDKNLLKSLIEKSTILINVNLDSIDEESKLHEILFHPREFYKTQFETKSSSIKPLTQDEFLEDIKSKTFVLISDYAGNGKSWMIKNLLNVLNKQNPTNWITYIDLKQHIEDFKRENLTTNFLKFIKTYIFKESDTIGLKVFEKLYNLGKVVIFFDGFDEISPNYSEIVLKLAESFEFNNGNQLWIATRDYYENDLLKRLHIDISYKLKPLTMGDGASLVAKSWIYKNAKRDMDFKSRQEFDQYVNSSQIFNKNRKKAIIIIQKCAIAWDRTLGLPQMFRMVADCYGNNECCSNGYEIYDNFTCQLLIRWQGKKSELSKKMYYKTEKNKSSYWKVHQFYAVKSSYPDFVYFLFPDFDESEWQENELISYGFITKEDNKLVFIHKTFGDFFVAAYIKENLEKETIKKNLIDKIMGRKNFTDHFYNFFSVILTEPIAWIIVSFVNDKIHFSDLKQLGKDMEQYLNVFYNMKNFRELFIKDLDNIAIFMMSILKEGKYEKVKDLLDQNVGAIVSSTTNTDLLARFQKFFIDSLKKVNDLKKIIIKEQIFQKLIKSTIDIEFFIKFVKKIETKTGKKFIRFALKIKFGDIWRGNILYFLYLCPNLSRDKVRMLFQFMKKYLENEEIFDLIQESNQNDDNIFKTCLLNQNQINDVKFEFIWQEIKSFLRIQKFKKLICQKDLNGFSILHWAAPCEQMNFTITLFKLLFELFPNDDDLIELILDDNKIIYFHYLVEKNKNTEILLKIFSKFQNNPQFLDVLMQKDEIGMRFLQFVTSCTKDLKFFQYIWNLYRDVIFSNQEFIEIIKEKDSANRNLFNFAADYSSHDILEYIILELEEIAENSEIKIMLGNKNIKEHNLLHTAALYSKSVQFHEILWNIIERYFRGWEILELVEEADKDGDNIFFKVVVSNTMEVAELTWNKIKELMNRNDQINYLIMTKQRMDTMLKSSKDNFKEMKTWIESLINHLIVCRSSRSRSFLV